MLVMWQAPFTFILQLSGEPNERNDVAERFILKEYSKRPQGFLIRSSQGVTRRVESNNGRNLDAINDSWVTGGICPDGPPFNFIFRGPKDIGPDFQQFVDTVSEIARESVMENGGEVTFET